MKSKYEIARGKRIRLYGITVTEYERLFNEQNGVCAICGKDNGQIALCIDHDHATNEVRGLLCNLCNRGIGLFNDNPNLLDKAKQYVIKGAPHYLKGKLEPNWSFGKYTKPRVYQGRIINEFPDLTTEEADWVNQQCL